MSVSVRSFVVIGVVLCGAAANAQSLILESAGTWSNPNGNDYFFQNETVLYPPSTTGVLPNLTTLSSVDQLDGSGNVASAVATYSDTTGDTLVLDWTITNNTYNGTSAESFDGTWTYAGGTGAYAPTLISGGIGTVAISNTNVSNGSSSGFSGTVLVGDLTPVPEPFSVSLLGLGALGLIRRRLAR